MTKFLSVVIALAMFSFGASGSELEVSFELPTFSTANYQKPYVAIWVESSEKNQTLSLWHMKKSHNDKWLKDIRRWWRKLGRYDETPDGVTGATQGAGEYVVKSHIEGLTTFTLYIEVVREDGGRSLLKQKIDLANAQTEYQLPDDDEISAVSIKIGQ